VDRSVDNLAPLFESDCTREEALKCWDKVFNTTFFISRLEKELEAAAAKAVPWRPLC
jgi:hypothetical protein